MIYCIMGHSGAGKSTVTKCLLNQPNLNLKPLTLLTTRPKRENEIDGDEYCFVCDRLYRELWSTDRILCDQVYRIATYKTPFHWGILKEDIDPDKYDYIVPASFPIFKELFQHYGKVIPIVLTAPPKVREQRMISHGDHESEVIRRMAQEYQLPLQRINPQFQMENTVGLSTVVGKITEAINRFNDDSRILYEWQLHTVLPGMCISGIWEEIWNSFF